MIRRAATRPKPGIDVYAHLNEVANQAAILLHIDDAILTDWFNRQVGWWMAHARKLSAAKASPLTVARLAHATETIALLRKRQHVLVCRKHGIQGVEGQEWLEVGQFLDSHGMSAFYVALANRGIFDLPEGGDYGEWERDCETCLQDVLRGVSGARPVSTQAIPITTAAAPPVSPQGGQQCSQCHIMTNAVAKGLNDALCANCFKAWKPRNARY